MMDIDPFSMLEVSLHESDTPVEVAENIEVDVDPSEVVQDGQAPTDSFTAVKEELTEPTPNVSNYNAMQLVIKNGNKLAVISPEEEAYRRKLYKTMNVVLRKRLHCTICDTHIGCHLDLKNEDIEHPLLKVLACSRCTFTYKYIDFPLTPDGKDVRCRWCTKPSSEDSPLRFCKHCPFAFCEMCIYRNLPLDELARTQDGWVCFVCNMSELWPSRAILWALHAQIQFNQSRCVDDRWKGDVSQCCKTGKSKKPTTLALPKIEAPDEDPKTNGHDDDDDDDVIEITPPSPPKPKPIMSVMGVGRRPLRTAAQRALPVVMSDYEMDTPVVRSLNTVTKIERPKPLPASKYETFWLKEKIKIISTTLQTLNANLTRVAKGVPDIDDKFNIKSKMISLTSLLNIGANQINTFTKELESEWKKVLETKSYKTVNKGLRRLPTPYRRVEVIKPKPLMTELSPLDKYYLRKHNIQPCTVRLIRLAKVENDDNDD